MLLYSYLLHMLKTSVTCYGMGYALWNGMYSELTPIKLGVPQGSVLGPPPFTSYLKDLFHSMGPNAGFSFAGRDELENITKSIRKADENILKMKPPESAPLSAAFAYARFIISLVKAIRGYPDITECAYIYSKAHPQLKYLSTPLLLGPSGVAKNLGIPELSDYETCLFDNAIPCLVSDIKRGEKFVGVVDPPPCDICDPNPNAPRCPRNWCEVNRR